ncbi:MAG TPA: short chain dehydrogenase [Actinotalea caeni]|uniref:short chain dehydrogenase n=1 Tax=Actinotalea caeni TaxID=1348467 RepID=UPI002B4B2076|nr:short chain dehydrogenase [Actinotalea caeni]HLV54229.1 short chain dehydrogenase [Actinotalea caeni]
MRVLVVGGEGTIGRHVSAELRRRGHVVVTAGRSSGNVRVDVRHRDSVADMYREIGGVDAVVATAAHGTTDRLLTLSRDELLQNMQGKLLGQVDLVLLGQHHAAAGASFTLTSGIFADEPWPGVTGGAMINAALHAFVRSAALELPRGMRVNVVSPTMVGDSVDSFASTFPGMRPVPMDALVTGYLSVIEGERTGEVVRAYG